jgi:CBS domain-containing protein
MQDPRIRLAAPPETLDDSPTGDPSVTAVMSPRVVAITPDASLRTALRLMATGDVRHLPVLDGARCLGVVVETDLVHAVAVGGQPVVGPLARPIPSVPVTVRRSAVARAMLVGDVDAVLVTAGGRLVGIVTATDLVRSLAEGAQPSGGRP